MNTTSDFLERAGRLVDDGDFRSAIALLEKAGSSHDPALAQRLIDLRIQAYANIDWPEPHSNWPPSHDNRFDSVKGFPEVAYSELDVGALKAGILGKGGLIVRGMMGPDRIEEMRDQRIVEREVSRDLGVEVEVRMANRNRMARHRRFGSGHSRVSPLTQIDRS